MKTITFNQKNFKEIIQTLKLGGVIIFPTDTVYGIGTLISNEKGIKKLFEIKNRPVDKPFQVLISDLKQIQLFAKETNQTAKELIKNHWPGPLTLIFKKKAEVLNVITANKDTIGLRMPDHPLLLKLMKKTGPLVVSSANLSGNKPPTNPEEVKIEADLLLNGGKCKIGQSSTIIDVSNNKPIILRNQPRL
ncbi:threonylcarbamoyl-AMP synthase [candidate division WOR-1 bacterium RIFOXYA2_FULL_36_21]|uniref:L-threonylcarbamoyladenylate synthase n=1 Tax=candidate division WOR-1 bacterium RIFOXYB2_FULL_36_35 TaxID=1802578 RepID=A0A1F4S7E7_UNCSA|nr:MAG: threonylcarbamoyl-AMP synthase [candidate division WOR-1 bacterium RIFOXYA2_FULL_36_21]OGC15695.1 MAG: threonylcarbamoyl-AMP synthase [candidate division WOR-1 bacterium RIFOXYA12_FULL_36_13]OGC16307.1 MAG: threonylcarbamoyl-AMP synthase [candidate division WOR-1 bacterium RIFOXYB2_FULL_36_35]